MESSVKGKISIDDLHMVGACASGVRDYMIENEILVTELKISDADLSNDWISRAFGINGYGDGYGDGSLVDHER